MYFDTDKWLALARLVKRMSPKEYGQYINNKKSKVRGGWKRGRVNVT